MIGPNKGTLGSSDWLNFLLFNPRSLNNKTDRVMLLIEDKSIDVAAISETWLADSSNPTTATIKSYGYSILHNHRLDKRGGGTALIFKSSLAVRGISCGYKYTSFEATIGCLKLEGNKKLLLVSMYRTGPLTGIFVRELDGLLSDLLIRFDKAIFAGDLNVHFGNTGKGIPTQVEQCFASYGLKRIVDEVTHVSGGRLDTIFVTGSGKLIQHTDPVIDDHDASFSDHQPVRCSFKVPCEKKYYVEKTYRKLKSIDSASFSLDLQSTWR